MARMNLCSLEERNLGRAPSRAISGEPYASPGVPCLLCLQWAGGHEGSVAARPSLSSAEEVATLQLLAGLSRSPALPSLIASSFFCISGCSAPRPSARLPPIAHHPPATPIQAGGGGSLEQLQRDDGRNPERERCLARVTEQGRSYTGPGGDSVSGLPAPGAQRSGTAPHPGPPRRLATCVMPITPTKIQGL